MQKKTSLPKMRLSALLMVVRALWLSFSPEIDPEHMDIIPISADNIEPRNLLDEVVYCRDQYQIFVFSGIIIPDGITNSVVKAISVVDKNTSQAIALCFRIGKLGGEWPDYGNAYFFRFGRKGLAKLFSTSAKEVLIDSNNDEMTLKGWPFRNMYTLLSDLTERGEGSQSAPINLEIQKIEKESELEE